VVESFNYNRINALEMTKGLISAEMMITSGVASQKVQWIPKFQLTRFDDPMPANGRRPELPLEEAAADFQPDVGLRLEKL
jgi:hypothetical protein